MTLQFGKKPTTPENSVPFCTARVKWLTLQQKKLRVTILGSGTSQGVPVIACQCPVCLSNDPYDKRLRSSIMVESGGTCIVVDTGPDFRQQMLREDVRTVDAILISHTHKDHIAGLDDVRSFNYLMKRPMKVYASKQDQEEIEREFAYAFGDKKYPGVPEIQLIDLSLRPFYVGDIHIQPVEVMHRYLKVFGFRFGRFAYLTDLNHIPANSMKLLKGVDYLVIDALRKEKHISHFNLEDAIEAAQLIGAKNTWFTHVSHLMGFHAQVNISLPTGMALAYDRLQIDIED